MAKLVSETYGEALFSLGMEKEIVDSLMDEIDSLWKILKENPGFSGLIQDPPEWNGHPDGTDGAENMEKKEVNL